MTTDRPGDHETLSTISDGMAAAVAAAGASVVTVHARRRVAASGIAWSADGLIVTADHVIEDDEAITVGLPGGATVPARLLGRDPGADLALLHVEAPTTAATPATGTPHVGALALAVGRPGDAIEASLGVVSAVGGAWRSRNGSRVAGYIRTDVTMFPGFSGGALVDARGGVLGMTSSRFRGASVALPVAAVTELVALLQAHGRVRRAYLGIGSQPVTLPAAVPSGQESGLLLVRVEPGSPAATAGLQVGDILLHIEDESMVAASDLQDALGPERVGVVVRLGLLRGGTPIEATVTPDERP